MDTIDTAIDQWRQSLQAFVRANGRHNVIHRKLVAMCDHN